MKDSPGEEEGHEDEHDSQYAAFQPTVRTFVQPVLAPGDGLAEIHHGVGQRGRISPHLVVYPTEDDGYGVCHDISFVPQRYEETEAKKNNLIILIITLGEQRVPPSTVVFQIFLKPG